MGKVKLGDYIEQIRGVSYSPADVKDILDENSVILLRANNIQNGKLNFNDVLYISKQKVTEKQYLQKGDILICTSSGSKELVGKAAYVTNDIKMVFGAFCKVIRPTLKCSKYVGHYFQSPCYRRTISNLSAGANINNIRNEHINELEIPIPPLEEQCRIASILDNVSSLIDKRRQQLEKLDLLVKSQFIEMFGDPIENPMNWEISRLTDLGTCKNGMNFHAGDSGIELNCLGVGDFKDLAVITDTSILPKVSLNEEPSEEYLLQDGDIVFVRSNGNKMLVGRCLAVYPQDIKTTFSGFCIRYRLISEKVHAVYLLHLLKTTSARQKLVGRGANIQNLNQRILGELMIPVPPFELQNEFVGFIQQADKSKFTINQSLEKLETLKKALMQQYFG